jgi:hypothetical protein
MTPVLEGVHLVGSVPLPDAGTVFGQLAARLGRHLARLPDGETGVRKDWIAWQYAVLASTPGLEPIPVGDRGYLRRQMVRIAGPRKAPRFGPLGYATAALSSFALFDRLQQGGSIPEGIRFQVSLPTPLAPMTVFVTPEDRALVEPAYEERLLEELSAITSAIPASRLAVQWDVAVEVAHLHGVWPTHFPDLERGVVDRLVRLGRAVPGGVSLGFHLCYGDFGHRHFMQVDDASTLVRLANALADLPLDFVHMPVPVSWSSPTPFAPLDGLRLPPATRLYLGLVHMADGVDGAKRRIALAGQHLARFGIATECGWGRRPPEAVPALIDLHATLLG